MPAPVPGTGCHPPLGVLAAVTTLGQLCISGGICAPFSGVGYSTPDSFSAPHASSACLSFSSVQSVLIGVRLFVTPWTAAHQASLSITNSWSLLKLMSIKSVLPPNHLILCRPFLLPPSICPSFLGFLTFCFQVAMKDLEPRWIREKLPASPPCTHLSHLGAPW